MTTKAHNAKKPKLAGHASGHGHAVGLANGEVLDSTPEPHKMSFAQHQHALQLDRTPAPMPTEEAPTRHLKADAQQHQQKAHSHK